MDDDAADWLMEYARALGSAHLTDTVTLRAIGVDGNEVSATFLLNSGIELMTETANTRAEAPRNDEVFGYMQERARVILTPPQGQPVLDPTEIQ
ncbi:hypothetical protein [Microbacterium sp. CPCC 204701]|uniref:hypothetical protein n=1 Tax=Microbacterium sp. CPCC 204701 TaxID=2493084 RepID=UPI000FDBAE89|nr:hypothetical protein [Microbacterium sp. CPCC 204701]